MIRVWVGAAMAVALVASTAIGIASCNANLAESCVTGPCYLGTGGFSYASSSSSAATSGAGGTGGSPIADAGDAGDATQTGPMNALACPTTPQTGEIPCDVFKIMHTICQQCHGTMLMNGAPFTLLNYADTQEPYMGLKGTVMNGASCELPASSANNNACAAGQCNGLRFQQMWISTGPDGCPQMPLGSAPLPEPDYTILRDWLAACAPPAEAGSGCGCPGNGCN